MWKSAAPPARATIGAPAAWLNQTISNSVASIFTAAA